jgi:DNA polymerase-3 subunit delta
MPAISSEKMIARLAKGDTVPAVLLLGADSYLRDACRARLVEVSVDPAARDWGVSRFSAVDDDLTHILGQAQTVPMLARRQVVVVSELEAIEHLGDDDREAAIDALGAYLDDPAPFTLLVLEAATLDQRMKLAKLLEDKALVIEAELPKDPEKRREMAAILAVEMARERQTPIEAEAAEELAELCNANLTAIRSEIEKLSTYAGPGQPIRRSDVAALVVSEKKHTVWELADMLATRRRSDALLFLDNLLREGEQAPALVGGMTWMFRKLLEAQDLGPHATKWQAASRLGTYPEKAQMALNQARKIPRNVLVEGFRALYDADSQLKSGVKSTRAVMEFLVTRLTGVVPGPAAAPRFEGGNR